MHLPLPSLPLQCLALSVAISSILSSSTAAASVAAVVSDSTTTTTNNNNLRLQRQTTHNSHGRSHPWADGKQHQQRKLKPMKPPTNWEEQPRTNPATEDGGSDQGVVVVVEDILDVIEEAEPVEVEVELGMTRVPTEYPTSAEPTTDHPTNIPTDTPTIQLERYHCIEETAPACFDEEHYWWYYTDYERCVSKCKGKKSCRSSVCDPTVSPSISPTTSSPTMTTEGPSVSFVPTVGPTLSPTVSNAPTVSDAPSLSPGMPSDQPSAMLNEDDVVTISQAEANVANSSSTTNSIAVEILPGTNSEEETAVTTSTTSSDSSIIGSISDSGNSKEETMMTTSTTSSDNGSTTAPPQFTFTIPEIEEKEEDPTESIPFTPFRLDFVVATTPKPDSSDNVSSGGNDEVNNGGLRKLSPSQENESVLFQSGQDAELLSLVSSHLLKQLERNLDEHKYDGIPIDVVLAVVDKSERAIVDSGGSGGSSSSGGISSRGEDVVEVSYDFIGYVIYALPDDVDIGVEEDFASSSSSSSSLRLPSTAVLDDAVLNAFNTRRGRRGWTNSLQYAEDYILKGIVSIVASTTTNPIIVGNELDPSKVTENDKNNMLGVNHGSNDASSTSIPLALPFVVLVASALAATFLILGLLTFRKYKRYQDNNARNDYLSYQHRKRKITIDTNNKKLRQYDHFESPEGSIASVLEHIGKKNNNNSCSSAEGGDLIYDLEMVVTTTRTTDAAAAAAADTGMQFRPSSNAATGNDNDDNGSAMPYDESHDGTSAAAYDMAYFSNAAHHPIMRAAMEDKSRIDGYETGYETEGFGGGGGCDETLEGLYSDKDSYFQSTIGGGASVIGGGGGHHHRRGDSIHSLDTLDNTFGNGNDGPVSHLIDGIERMMDNNRDVDVSIDLESTLFEDEGNGLSETTRILLENHDITHIFEEDEDANGVFEDTSEDGIVQNSIANTSNENNVDNVEEGVLQEDGDNSKDVEDQKDEDIDCLEKSAISTTDELYARITELEKKILNTESQLAQDDSILLGSPSKMETEPSLPPPASAPSPHASKNHDAMSEEASPTTCMGSTSSSSIQKGIFTTETLGMIERSRLSGTPPPSESEVDNELIREAKENPLLGKAPGDHTDSEEEGSAFELV